MKTLCTDFSRKNRKIRYQYLFNLSKEQKLSEAEALELSDLNHQYRNEMNAMITGFLALVGASIAHAEPLAATLIGVVVGTVSWYLHRHPV